MKKTKIVATMGPASTSSIEILKQMIIEGVNVCRLNFSHGSHEDHKRTIEMIREINKESEYDVSILADLQGPKIRIGEVENNGIELVDGENLTITTNECIGTKDKVYLTYQEFPLDVSVGDKVLMDDGKLQLEVTATNRKDKVETRIVHGGILSSKKGVNLPNTKISLPCITPKDSADLAFALANQVDWVGLSFVRSARDIIELKHIIRNAQSHAKVVAKIEKPEAIDDIEDIIIATDAIMVARGDLGVEVPMETVPNLQKMMIKICRKFAKPIIVATQMMESMITNFTPTRAEVNDVANAVLDGTDAVMLSGETSVGKYPIEVIRAMTKIVNEVEKNDEIYHKEELPEKNQDRFITDSVCFNATRLAQRVEAKGIITMTFSGYTAYKISSQRPKCSTFVFTENRQLLTQLNLLWGVQAFYYDKMVSTDHTISDSKYILKKKGLLKEGELVINIASVPIEDKGKSNMVKLSYV
ncbi:pyruvate kinase [Crocinitomix catalasitica]|uniref:pyruvate kinase n=1 Tax=Crocinitomix catalasitica TaxID=184607 RepID=UPI0004838DEC|nr:pyruvate kinase [Crocinitomix catalasitica]